VQSDNATEPQAHYPTFEETQRESSPGMLTQGGGERRPAPSASRLHRIPTYFLLNLHGVWWKLPTAGPPG
jgi:hypothetical protein